MKMKRYRTKVFRMKFDKLLISLAIFVFSVSTIHGIDPMSPSQLGESMDMPLPQDMLHDATSAGITKGSSQVTESMPIESSSGNLGTAVAASDSLGNSGTQQTSVGELNVSGPVSLILQDKAVKYLNLELRQSDLSVLGGGSMISGNSAQNVTVSGLVENGKLRLTIAPEGNTLRGSYSVPSADGAQSGTATGILSNGAAKLQSPQILSPQSSAIAVGATRTASTTVAGAVPVQLGQGSRIGSTFSSSKSISMSTGVGGSMVSSASSMSF
jgi:hypothetical protein